MCYLPAPTPKGMTPRLEADNGAHYNEGKTAVKRGYGSGSWGYSPVDPPPEEKRKKEKAPLLPDGVWFD